MTFTVVFRAGWIVLLHHAEVVARAPVPLGGTEALEAAKRALVRRGREMFEGFGAAAA